MIQAQGKLVQAEANLRYAQTAPRQMQISRSRAASAEAQVMQKKAALDQAQLNLQYTKAVSYTHLDVYKRQALLLALKCMFTLVLERHNPSANLWRKMCNERNRRETNNARLGVP